MKPGRATTAATAATAATRAEAEDARLFDGNLGTLATGLTIGDRDTLARARAIRDRYRNEQVTLSMAGVFLPVGLAARAREAGRRADAIDRLIHANKDRRQFLAEPEGPTPEARTRRLRRDPIEILAELGHIDIDQERRANEIAAVYFALTRSLLARGGMSDTAGRARYRREPRHLALSDREWEIYEGSYLPWLRRLPQPQTYRTPKGAVRQVAIDAGLVMNVIVGDHSLDEARRIAGIGWAMGLWMVRAALDLYEKHEGER